jgi:cell division GTPase FtsZ
LDVREAVLEKIRERMKREVRHLLTIPVVFSLGSGAGRVLAGVDASRIGAVKVAINSSIRDLKQIEGQVDLSIPCGGLGGSGMNPEKGREDYLEVADVVPHIVEKACEAYGCEDPDVVVTIASVGHGFGSGSLPEHVKVIKGSYPNTVHIVFAVTPFHFEGEAPMIRAYVSLREAVKQVTVFPLSNHIAGMKLGMDPRKVKVSDVFNAINSHVAEVLNTLFSALTATEGVRMGMDRSDLMSLIRGEVGAIGMAKYQSLLGLTADRVLQDVASSIYVKPVVGPDGAYGTYLVDSCEKVPLSLLNELSRLLVSRWMLKTQYLKPLILERDRLGSSILVILTNLLLRKHVEGELQSLILGSEAGEYWSKSLAKKIKGLFSGR